MASVYLTNKEMGAIMDLIENCDNRTPCLTSIHSKIFKKESYTIRKKQIKEAEIKLDKLQAEMDEIKKELKVDCGSKKLAKNKGWLLETRSLYMV